jgi:hypothetical protein
MENAKKLRVDARPIPFAATGSHVQLVKRDGTADRNGASHRQCVPPWRVVFTATVFFRPGQHLARILVDTARLQECGTVVARRTAMTDRNARAPLQEIDSDLLDQTVGGWADISFGKFGVKVWYGPGKVAWPQVKPGQMLNVRSFEMPTLGQ